MTTKKSEFAALAARAVESGALRKLVLSRPRDGAPVKVTGRAVALRGGVALALEYSLPQDTVSQRNLRTQDIRPALEEELSRYGQADLLTALGNAEWRVTKKGTEALLGGAELGRKLTGERPAFESAIAALDRRKQYILTGEEPFLAALGITDKSGRVHDKRQGKFRQINRFLEYIADIYPELPGEGPLLVYDLCCGKSYLSFAVYYYLTALRGREVRLLGIDRKRDVIDYCRGVAEAAGFSGMTFFADDIRNTPRGQTPDMVISLQACDTATDAVLERAIELGARVILSTPCCHRYMKDKIGAPALSFITRYPHIAGKLNEAVTDALRAEILRAAGYRVTATELTDPDDTPKNTLIRAVKRQDMRPAEAEKLQADVRDILAFLTGDADFPYPIRPHTEREEKE